MDRLRLDRSEVALLVVDVQERLCRAMDEARLARLMNRSLALVQGARVLGLPIVYTEQYPKGLGHTLEPLRAALENTPRIEKLTFSSALPEVLSAFMGRKRILIAGMETHICVFQTVRDLAQKGYVPYVCRDAVISRTDEDRLAGLGLAEQVGAVLTSTEAALFDMLGVAGTAEFKAISAAVK